MTPDDHVMTRDQWIMLLTCIAWGPCMPEDLIREWHRVRELPPAEYEAWEARVREEAARREGTA